MSVGYGEGAPSPLTTMPPTIGCIDRSSELTAAAAIGVAALPNAKIQTRDARLSERASIARAVAVLGDAAARAASYNSNRSFLSGFVEPLSALVMLGSSILEGRFD